MSVKITYFVHGTTMDNENGISSGWNDAKLSLLGVKQSKDLTLQISDKKFDVVFTSDLKRAVDSAELTFGGIMPIVQDKRLRECNYGDYNGKPSDIVEPLQEKSIFNRMPNGESYEDVRERIFDFLKDLKNNYDGKNVAIVAHKAPQLALDVILKGKTWKQAFAEDWRKTKSWQPGWGFELKKIPSFWSILNNNIESNLNRARGFKKAYELIYNEFLNTLENNPNSILLEPLQTLFLKAVEIYLRSFLLYKGRVKNWEETRSIMKSNYDSHDLSCLWDKCKEIKDFVTLEKYEKSVKWSTGSSKNYSGVVYAEKISSGGKEDIEIMENLDKLFLI